MTPEQEIFDTAVRALIKQGRSGSVKSVCQYRGSDGTKCAIGHLISDEEYDPEFDDVDIPLSEILERFSSKHILNRVDIRFLRDLRDVHDTASGVEQEVDNYTGPPRPTFVEEFKRRARVFAEKRGLSTGALDE